MLPKIMGDSLLGRENLILRGVGKDKELFNSFYVLEALSYITQAGLKFTV